MGTKINPGAFDCYSNALSDEPMFVLLARDPDFYRLVSEWANRRFQDVACGLRPESDRAAAMEAYTCAAAGQKWRKDNEGAWRKPAPAALEWPPQRSAVGLLDGERSYGSTGQLFEVKNGRWERVVEPLPGPKRSAAPYCNGPDDCTLGGTCATCIGKKPAPPSDTSRLAEGCCSVVSPCSHQQRDPSTICDACKTASQLSDTHRPEDS